MTSTRPSATPSDGSEPCPRPRTPTAAARRTVTSDPRRTSELLRKEALVDHDLDRVPQALRTLTRAMHLVHASDGSWVEGQLGELESDYAGCRHEQGRYREAIRWARLAEAHAQAAGELRALAQAYEVLQMAHVLSGRPQDRPYGQLALEMFQQLGDQSSQAKALNNLAVLAWMEGRGREALAMFERASAAFSAAGDTLHAAMADYNRGDVLLRQNRIPEARAILERLLPVMRALDSDNYWAPTLRGLGLADLREGRVQDGLDKLGRARETVERLGFAAEVVETDLAIVEGLLAAGTDEGLRRADELASTATARARAMEAGYLLPSLLRLRSPGTGARRRPRGCAGPARGGATALCRGSAVRPRVRPRRPSPRDERARRRDVGSRTGPAERGGAEPARLPDLGGRGAGYRPTMNFGSLANRTGMLRSP